VMRFRSAHASVTPMIGASPTVWRGTARLRDRTRYAVSRAPLQTPSAPLMTFRRLRPEAEHRHPCGMAIASSREHEPHWPPAPRRRSLDCGRALVPTAMKRPMISVAPAEELWFASRCFFVLSQLRVDSAPLGAHGQDVSWN
jgi:hypothetical protein